MAIVTEYDWESDTFTHAPAAHTNGHATGASSYDSALDTLYAFWPGLTPAPPACPEALFSVTLRGKLDGIETLLTVRGMTPEEFRHNLQQVRGLLDQPQTPVEAVRPAAGWCPVHDCAMPQTSKDGRTWFSHRTAEGWCKGKEGRRG